MSNLSISNKIHLPLIASIIVGFVIIMVSYFVSIDELETDVYKTEDQSVRSVYKDLMGGKMNVGLTNAINIAENYYVVQSLKTGDRDLAIGGLASLSKKFKESTEFQNVQIHVHDANVKSFLRAWKPEKFGDDLTSFRYSIVKVKETQKPLVTIELGVAGLSLRGIAPITEEGSYLGSVEFMQGLNSVVKSAKDSYGVEIAMVVDNKYLDHSQGLVNAPKVGNFVLGVNESVVNKNFFTQLASVDFKDTKTIQFTKEYLVVSEPIYDFSQNIVGYALLGKPLSAVEGVVEHSKESLVMQVIIMAVSTSLS